MVSLTLGALSLTFERTIDFNAEQTSSIPIPAWINNSTELSNLIFNKSKEKVDYTTRLTDEELYILIQIMEGHDLVVLDDSEYYSTNMHCWIGDWTATYDGDINATRPWNVVIILVTMEIDV